MTMQHVPDDDTATYDMICRADTVGVFQIESRAQMSMLPRLKPRCYYDLVVEVAIVRPGPIQGGMVHPYLNNRTLPDDQIDCPEELKPALARTKGVPIFQEQVMQIAMLAADFTAGEADALRRAMAAWKRRGGLSPFHKRLVGRMVEKGYTVEYAERIFKQIQGFGEYGFPESHAAGFALLAYVSSWIKCHHADAFLCGLLNAQPMGFYAPAQLVRDAREHGVEVRAVDVQLSAWESTLEGEGRAGAAHAPARRRHAGPRREAGRHGRRSKARSCRRCGSASAASRACRRRPAQRIVDARAGALFAGVEDLARRARLDAHALVGARRSRCLAEASPAIATRRRGPSPASTPGRPRCCDRRASTKRPIMLAAPNEGEQTLADYRALGLTLNRHPLALLRREARRVQDRDGGDAARLSERAPRSRQRPGHAPAAARDGQGHGLRHARGRDRRDQRHRLAEDRRRATQGAARRDAAHRLRPVAEAGRRAGGGDAPARRQDDRPHRAAAGPGEPQPRLPLARLRQNRARWARSS